jgi:hypothetical protein
MLDADPEHLLEWYSVGLYSRQLLYAALHPQEAHESFDIEQEAVHYSMADLAEDEEVPSCT